MEITIVSSEKYWDSVVDSFGNNYLLMKPEFEKWMDLVVHKDSDLNTSS